MISWFTQRDQELVCLLFSLKKPPSPFLPPLIPLTAQERTTFFVFETFSRLSSDFLPPTASTPRTNITMVSSYFFPNKPDTPLSLFLPLPLTRTCDPPHGVFSGDVLEIFSCSPSSLNILLRAPKAKKYPTIKSKDESIVFLTPPFLSAQTGIEPNPFSPSAPRVVFTVFLPYERRIEPHNSCGSSPRRRPEIFTSGA